MFAILGQPPERFTDFAGEANSTGSAA